LQFAHTDKQRRYLTALVANPSPQAIAPQFGVDPRSIFYVVEACENRSNQGRKKPNTTIVGIIGDTHLPYELDGYLEFCQKTFKKNKVKRVIHIGDLFDNHALSFHDSEPSLKGAYGERIDALERLQPWKDAFPEMTIVHGNHDAIPARQMTKVGLDPSVYLRPCSQVYNFPQGWCEVEDITIDGVIYHHGHTALGVNGFRNDAKNRMQNSVSGHAHSNLGIAWTGSQHRAVWGMAVGCGVDNKKMAFAYGKHFKNKPMVGCGVVKHGIEPHVFAMQLGED
jgi:predicted phosphodiesterase